MFLQLPLVGALAEWLSLIDVVGLTVDLWIENKIIDS